ncbi:MAG TPA: hypothetical protein VKG25_12460 [Bryobacteraceae bacterium]|nr:hypothetical protein [Bryobacteraceae bacterium]
MKKLCLCLACAVSALFAQLTPSDTVFAGLSARTKFLAYEQAGGDTKDVQPLMKQQNYRALTHAMVLMDKIPWTPAAELATGLDFAISAKLVGTGETLASRATFLFDAPAAADAPYRMKLDLLQGDGATKGQPEASVEPGIVLGDVRGRLSGETIGLTFDPSKLVGPGLHTLRATLQDGQGNQLFQYFRTFYIVADLGKRTAALDKTLELLPKQDSPGALTLRQIIETVQLARHTYYGTGFQTLTGYVFTAMRAVGLGLKDPVDFPSSLDQATRLAAALKDGSDPTLDGRGSLALAYRSDFDGKLLPYRVYVPKEYDRAKKYPLVVLLHGAGGDEGNFLDDYQRMWPKLAEEHGYLLASVNGRGPLSGYAKENGAEQDVLDVLGIMQKRYNVDPNRIFLGGHSMGGMGTWRIGMAYRDRFAGLIPIAGTMKAVSEAPLKASGKKIPLMIVAGEKDALVPAAGCKEMADEAKSLDYPVTYKQYPNQDHLTVAVVSIPDIFTWLDAQSQGGAVPNRDAPGK